MQFNHADVLAPTLLEGLAGAAKVHLVHEEHQVHKEHLGGDSSRKGPVATAGGSTDLTNALRKGSAVESATRCHISPQSADHGTSLQLPTTRLKRSTT